MAGKVQYFKVFSPLKLQYGLTRKYHANCHYSYNLPLATSKEMNTDNNSYLLKNEETTRLKFRLLQEEDFNLWKPLFEAENVALFLGLDTKLNSIELCNVWFDKVFHRYENNLGGMNVLIDKKTNQLVGQCGLLIQTVEKIERLEIGYSILPKYWNNGFASEASQKCKNYAFEKGFSESLISIVHIDNFRSEMVAKKMVCP